MRISDWSSDVCSSDLVGVGDPRPGRHAEEQQPDEQHQIAALRIGPCLATAVQRRCPSFDHVSLRIIRYNDDIIFISNRAMVNRDSGERTLTSVLRWDKLAQRRKSGSIVFRPGCVTLGVVVWSGWLRQHRSILKFGLDRK